MKRKKIINENGNGEPLKIKEGPRRAFYIVLILIPVFFFAFLEFSLRLFNYGTDTSQWKEIFPGKLMLNSAIAHRYFFTTESVPYSNQEIFNKVKAQNSFRVFIMGESSAAGYPYMPVGAFSDYIRKRLELQYPESEIEVVNLSMTAINTYAIRDMFPGVLEQKPDLIIIYTGHNEYYGALGVGSMEYVGGNPAIVNFILSLNGFKTIELLRNIMAAGAKIFSDKTEPSEGGTLMSKIASGQYIPFGSEKYHAGLMQFESNMSDILMMASEKKVPVILGTLACNLKDQKPFYSMPGEGRKGAMQVFLKAKEELEKGNNKQASLLFEKARDLDAVRFRAPGEVNSIIRKLGRQYGCPVAEIDSAFSKASPMGITGDNLMTDHLHPSVTGYRMIGRLYFEKMSKAGCLPRVKPLLTDEAGMDALTLNELKVSRLDSVIASYRILALKNDWPFIEKKDKKTDLQLFKIKDYIDSLAFMVCFEDLPWEKAHRRAADWYLARNNFREFRTLVDILIERFPVIKGYYTFIVNKLLTMNKYDDAYLYLKKYYAVHPDAYSSKWLGIIDLSRGNNEKAIIYLKESLRHDGTDPQVQYNLAGAYVNLNDYNKALETINSCLKTDPAFPGAADLKVQLTSALKNAR